MSQKLTNTQIHNIKVILSRALHEYYLKHVYAKDKQKTQKTFNSINKIIKKYHTTINKTLKALEKEATPLFKNIDLPNINIGSSGHYYNKENIKNILLQSLTGGKYSVLSTNPYTLSLQQLQQNTDITRHIKTNDKKFNALQEEATELFYQLNLGSDVFAQINAFIQKLKA